MARPFPDVYYDRVVPRQQLLNKALHCVPFENKRLPLNICLLSRQLLVNCTFIFANIVNSKLVLFSARIAEKLVLNGCIQLRTYNCTLVTRGQILSNDVKISQIAVQWLSRSLSLSRARQRVF